MGSVRGGTCGSTPPNAPAPMPKGKKYVLLRKLTLLDDFACWLATSGTGRPKKTSGKSATRGGSNHQLCNVHLTVTKTIARGLRPPITPPDTNQNNCEGAGVPDCEGADIPEEGADIPETATCRPIFRGLAVPSTNVSPGTPAPKSHHAVETHFCLLSQLTVTKKTSAPLP